MSTTNGTHGPTGQQADIDIDLLYSWTPPQTPPPPPCPEATFSLTLKGRLNGQEALLTARGQTAAEFKRNLEAIAGLLDPVPTPAPAQGQSRQGPARQGQGYCLVHETTMHLNHGKDGRSWFSHRLPEGGFCKGKGR